MASHSSPILETQSCIEMSQFIFPLSRPPAEEAGPPNPHRALYPRLAFRSCNPQVLPERNLLSIKGLSWKTGLDFLQRALAGPFAFLEHCPFSGVGLLGPWGPL